MYSLIGVASLLFLLPLMSFTIGLLLGYAIGSAEMDPKEAAR